MVALSVSRVSNGWSWRTLSPGFTAISMMPTS
jgi:hypothetical protein